MSLTENIPPSCNQILNHGITASQQTLRQTPVKEQDDCTECETPFSSPDFESRIVTRNMTQSAKEEMETGIESKDTGDQEHPLSALVGSGTKVLEEGHDKRNSCDNWPMSNIPEPGKNDVLFGRGGGTNHHDGNKRYRKMVEERKVDYVNSKRLDKPLVALDIIRQWRAQNPPGRFLKFDDKSDTWFDVGDKKAREKTSQALREKAPLLRKQQEEQRREMDVLPDMMGRAEEVVRENVRPSKNIARAMLAREHSLGCDYVPAEDLKNAMKGFSWDSNDVESNDGESESPDDISTNVPKAQEWGHPPPQRNSTWSHPKGMGDKVPLGPPPISNISRDNHMDALNPLPPTLLPSTNGTSSRQTFDEYASPFTSNRSTQVNQWQQQRTYNSPPGASLESKPQGEWTKPRYGHRDYQYDYCQPRSLEYNYRSRNYWDQRRPWQHDVNDGGFGYREPVPDVDPYPSVWEGYQNGYSYRPTVDNTTGNPHFNQTYENWTSPNRFSDLPQGRRFHGQRPQCSPQSASQPFYTDRSDEYVIPNGAAMSPHRREHLHDNNYGENTHSPSGMIPRPQPIKRDTSHQNETSETKSQVKRMNRQCSTGARRENSMVSLEEVSEKDMQNLGKNFRRSSLGGSKDVDVNPLKKPNAINSGNRTFTIDQADIAYAIEGNSSPLDGVKHKKPNSFHSDNRGNSLESIAMDEIAVLISKPPTIKDDDRSNTLGTIGTIESI